MADEQNPIDLSVFERLAQRFSECQAQIASSKKTHGTIESLIIEAGVTLDKAISSKEIEFEDAPHHFYYVPTKKDKSGGKRKAYDIYWLNAIYWICVNRRELFPDWPKNNAAEFLWTVRFHPDRFVEGSLEETILHTRSAVLLSVMTRWEHQCQRKEIRRSRILEVCLDLASLCEDVCSYLADMLTSKPKSAETEHENGADIKPSQLTDTENNILEALGKDTLRGPELLKKTGYDYSSHYRSILSNLVKRQILGRNSNGYYAR